MIFVLLDNIWTHFRFVLNFDLIFSFLRSQYRIRSVWPEELGVSMNKFSSTNVSSIKKDKFSEVICFCDFLTFTTNWSNNLKWIRFQSSRHRKVHHSSSMPLSTSSSSMTSTTVVLNDSMTSNISFPSNDSNDAEEPNSEDIEKISKVEVYTPKHRK